MNFTSKAAVGLLGMTIDTLWYLMVALVLTGTAWLDKLKRYATTIHRLTAVVLWGFALSVVWQPVNADMQGNKTWTGCSERCVGPRLRSLICCTAHLTTVHGKLVSKIPRGSVNARKIVER